MPQNSPPPSILKLTAEDGSIEAAAAGSGLVAERGFRMVTAGGIGFLGVLPATFLLAFHMLKNRPGQAISLIELVQQVPAAFILLSPLALFGFSAASWCARDPPGRDAPPLKTAFYELKVTGILLLLSQFIGGDTKVHNAIHLGEIASSIAALLLKGAAYYRFLRFSIALGETLRRKVANQYPHKPSWAFFAYLGLSSLLGAPLGVLLFLLEFGGFPVGASLGAFCLVASIAFATWFTPVGVLRLPPSDPEGRLRALLEETLAQNQTETMESHLI